MTDAEVQTLLLLLGFVKGDPLEDCWEWCMETELIAVYSIKHSEKYTLFDYVSYAGEFTADTIEQAIWELRNAQ